MLEHATCLSTPQAAAMEPRRHGGPVSARALRRRVDPPRLRASRVVAGAPGPVRIAGVPYPQDAEARHTLVCGADGAGRHALLCDLVAQLRALGERCVILDGTGRYTEAFFDPGRDVLLNPLDERAPRWSPFLEARSQRDFVAMADSLVPRQAHSLQRIRAAAAGRVFARVASRLWRDGVTSNRALVKHLLHADVSKELGTLKRAFGCPELDPADPGHALAVGAFLSDMAGALDILPDGGRPFAIRDWVLADSERAGGCLFLSPQGAWQGRLRGLTAAWLEVAVDALHWRGWRDTERVWVIVDDIASVNAVPGLKAALAEGPSFRGRVVLGVPVIAALRKVYGTPEADAIADLCGTRAVFRVGGATAAMRSAQCLGESDTGLSATGAVDGAGARSGAVSRAPERNPRLTVSPYEIQCLKDREGYLKFPGPWPVGRFRIRDRKRRPAAPGFVPRRPGPSGEPGDGRTGGNGHGPGDTGGRASAQGDRGSPKKQAGNARLNGKAPDKLNWC